MIEFERELWRAKYADFGFSTSIFFTQQMGAKIAGFEPP